MRTRYNERSWAIDVISEINRLCSERQRAIKRAGGERTISTEEGTLFPDVLLFENESGTSLLQGWELKMPDTPLSDWELLAKAEGKAKSLNLGSFLVWNVSSAALYVSDDLERYTLAERWDDLAYITERWQVEEAREEWVKFLEKLLGILNDLFEKGELAAKDIIETFDDNRVVDIILESADPVADMLQKEAVANGKFDAKVMGWWRGVKFEYGGEKTPWRMLARCNLINWVNKICFSHVIKAFHSGASIVERIRQGTSPAEALQILNEISEQCNFWCVFEPTIGECVITDRAWAQIVQLNGILCEIQFTEIDQELLQRFIENTISVYRRKFAGQYMTPPALARLLVMLTMIDKRMRMYDPFCGTGTIPRTARDIKVEYGVKKEEANRQIWASDKYSFQLQVATIALSDPYNMGRLLHVFPADAFVVKVGDQVQLADPNDGHKVTKVVEPFECICSNLPFVRREDIGKANRGIKQVCKLLKREVGDGGALDTKSDLFAYIPFHLWHLLGDGGRLGVIVSNAWLGTEWGKTFRGMLGRYFRVERVIVSKKGKWFKNSDVVTNIVVLQKREKIVAGPDEAEVTAFYGMNRALEECEGPDDVRVVADAVLADDEECPYISKRAYGHSDIRAFEDLGLEWNSLFADLRWLGEVQSKLVRMSDLFEIKRGERRGWDKLFYPGQGHGIEEEYIKPVLKSSRDVSGLVADADADAFCCSKSLEELKVLGHKGALAWVKRFSREVNDKGERLTLVLARSNMFWYEMKDATLADLVANINYDERIFIAKMRKRSFVNQRLIRFTQKSEDIDIDLCHALLNSIVGIFYLEAMGFGRGLGALDLNSTKIRRGMRLLNPGLLSQGAAKHVKEAFLPLLKREILPVTEELQQPDRQSFDLAVMDAFELSHCLDAVIGALFELYEIRRAVKE